MAYYTVYYTVSFYPYKSLIYKGFSAAWFSVNPKKSDSSLRQLIQHKKHRFFSALFPLLAAEIVIALAFWLLFATVLSPFITRLLHGQGDQKVIHYSLAHWCL